MKLGRVAAAALVALGLGARPAYAWDELGHRVVARIAWDHLTPQAQAAAVRLLMNAPARSGIPALAADAAADRGRELFVMAAVWPDIIRSRTYIGNAYAHSDWHYVNFFWEQRAPGGPPIEHPEMNDGELLNQLPRLAATLADPAASDSARAVALAWVLHLVGDGHQPLHNSARLTSQDPQGDRGGNLFLLGGLYPRSNLHGYWDGIVGFSEPWAVGERTEADYVGHVAAVLARAATRPPGRAPGSCRADSSSGRARGWCWPSARCIPPGWCAASRRRRATRPRRGRRRSRGSRWPATAPRSC